MQGIIVENISNQYQVVVDIENQSPKEKAKNVCQKIYEATARGRFKKEEISPVVGDIVEIEVTDEENSKAVIDTIQERSVFVKRPKLANITQIVFVISSKDPKPDLLMLDKQLAFAEFLGIKSLIVCNKIDLDEKKDWKQIKNVYEKIGYKVIETEAKNQKGMTELKQELRDHRNAFSGNSGVRKVNINQWYFQTRYDVRGRN